MLGNEGPPSSGDQRSSDRPGVGPVGDLSDLQFEWLRRFIAARAGLHFTDPQRPQLNAKVRRRVLDAGAPDVATYLSWIGLEPGADSEVARLIHEVTVHRGAFFRHPDQFESVRAACRAFLDARPEARPVMRAWSAGCGAGEEPYTLAMVAHRELQDRGDFSVLATDVSRPYVEEAMRAIYHRDCIAGVPEPFRSEGFVPVPSSERDVSVAPEIKRRVAFRVGNLVEDCHDRSTAEMDVVFCRNVLMYFDFATRKDVLRALLGRVGREGYLVLGPCDAIQGLGSIIRQTARSRRILAGLSLEDLLFPTPARSPEAGQ